MKWINVEEDLPYKNGGSQIRCLVFDKYNGIVVRFYNEFHDCWDQEDMDDYYTDSKDGDITHWMYLPDPPGGL